MATKRHQVIANIERLLAAFDSTLPAENISDARDLLEHDEWGEAFDLLCTQLYEFDVELSVELYELIEATGNAMSIDREQWEYLSELVR